MVAAAVATRLPSLMMRLRDATAAVREDRELLGARVSAADYQAFLLRMYGFYAAVERALAGTRPLRGVVKDAGLRNHKSALLAADLVALGLERWALPSMPRMAFAGALPLPDALGWTYVLESFTMTNKQVARRLARQLPGQMQTAAAYLGCYGDEAPERWRELGEALDACELSPRDSDRAVETAREGFVRLGAWLRPALPAKSSSRIHA